MTEVLLVRHGESEYNRKELIQGQIDSELTAKGRKQAEQLAQGFEVEDFDAVYSSDLKRARDTADIISGDSKLEIVERKQLRERDLGVLEDRHYTNWNEIDTENHHEWRPENGESLKEHKERASEVLEEILDRDLDSALVVAHGGAIRAILMHILDCESRQAWRMRIDNCGLTKIENTEEGWLIRYVNRRPEEV